MATAGAYDMRRCPSRTTWGLGFRLLGEVDDARPWATQTSQAEALHAS